MQLYEKQEKGISCIITTIVIAQVFGFILALVFTSWLKMTGSLKPKNELLKEAIRAEVAAQMKHKCVDLVSQVERIIPIEREK